MTLENVMKNQCRKQISAENKGHWLHRLHPNLTNDNMKNSFNKTDPKHKTKKICLKKINRIRLL